MIQEKCNQTHQYFQAAKRACQSKIAALQADHRADEAVFMKIRLNVFEIFHSVFSVAENTEREDASKLIAFFRMRLDNIPRSWETALEKAKQHENTEAIFIENIKLDTVTQIRVAFYQIWGDE